ncbi:regulator of G-protein signaling loco isoform X2 [Drosophila virilis]|uniref:regulator of G-protein signaling loco isoform X2 n=1 Tax=Drosophila virilis TaxID=7244 RepID=UPI0013961EA2|nr:regulator of G-protein signaling loco isoform X2 [Drosophila virilis]XP_032289760.1 regulator of G-protein signaling loco isoform X2 [Drosophila virilis]
MSNSATVNTAKTQTKQTILTNNNNSSSICNMVERFVQSLGQLNDSGSCFDTSFEVKHILQSPSLLAGTPTGRQRHRCLTELDREQLTRFVQEFEARQSVASTPKAKCMSPFLCRKAKEIYRSASGRRSASPHIYIEPVQELEEHQQEQQQQQHTRKSAEAEDLMPPPMALARVQAERRSCRSASRVLQFFSSATKRRSGSRKLSEVDTDASRASSPVLLRVSASKQLEEEQQQQLGCMPLPGSGTGSGSDEDEEHDDGISSASSNLTSQSSSCSSNSRNISPDSSFEMHAPLLPSFKVTPPRGVCKAGKTAASEFARFLRGSFYAKRASITTLRRSLSDPDAMQQLDFTKPPPMKTTLQPLGDVSNLMRNRALPTNASPFRRAWGQSSFRTSRTDKVAKAGSGSSPLVRRTASMNASDNDVYIKTLMLDELKPPKQQPQQLAIFQVPQILTTPAPPSTVMVKAAAGVVVESALELAPQPEQGGPGCWGTSFERMLQDAAGMQTFAEFLKKEFSAENIYFWTACERYRCLESETERVTLAREIFGKHLANSSSDPVNVDSQARNLSDEKLASGDSDIFAAAQKQIFNLMKFDSYQRFIRSDLYKSCVEAEQKQQPLPYTGANLDELLKTNFHVVASPKLKKSASNAEDRRRKSLLPWHRKTRSKSRDRSELMADLQQTLMPPPQAPGLAPPPQPLLALLTGGSVSDLHSSRSSLSSFDAGQPGQGASADSVCSLCRVILTDGATTIVQTRPGETVGQLVERLLEKRNLVYPYYDVVFQGSNKSIDTQQSSQLLAGKEVLIERRVAFKLDLPDPKVISVKSKPKKQLHEVIRPILNKYNYQMERVQVLLRDTQAPLDLMQPVTVADGQRLQIALIQPDFQQGGGSSMPPKHSKPMKPLPTLATDSTQGQLDELTNKMFNELLQSKADAAAAASASTTHKPSDMCSMKSNEAPSESSSSLFERMRRQQRDNSNIPGSKLPKLKKKSTSSQHSEEAGATAVPNLDPKKPIIAKLKAGVKLQSTERVAEHQDELLEGLKRAQLARLEDQRGTEINFDLPDFLKNKENLNAAASKLRKVRANLSPVNKASNTTVDAPQPAPRLSITRGQQPQSPMKVDLGEQETELPAMPTSIEQQELQEFAKAPPPLPPKPKVLPIKPSNWGVANAPPNGNYSNKFSPAKLTSTTTTTSPTTTANAMSFAGKLPLDIARKSLEQASTRCAYLDEPSSSFV